MGSGEWRTQITLEHPHRFLHNHSMQTRCPQCNAVYHITLEQLTQAQGRVRCSECKHVFDASKPLLDENNPQTDFFIDYKRDAIEQNNTIIYSELIEDSAIVPAKRMWPSVLIGLFLIAALLLQVAYTQRMPLLHSKNVGPWLESACNELSFCTIPIRTDMAQLELDNRQLYAHPNQPQALILSASFTNRAPFEQPLPNILVSMSDQQGREVANRLFKPAEYLSPIEQTELGNSSEKTTPSSMIQTQQQIQFNLELLDPGEQAKGFEIIFVPS